MIYYTLQGTNSTLGVYCSKCGHLCTFKYSFSHDDIAFWTKNKKSILCPSCANLYSHEIYRKVHMIDDIPFNRSMFKSQDNYDNYLFKNKCKEDYDHIFCSSKDELMEIENGIPKIAENVDNTFMKLWQ